MYRTLIMALVFCTVIAAAAFGQEPLPRAAQKLPPLTILSIIPAQGEPGITVTLNGTGFSEGTVAFLGTRELPTALVGGKVLTFELPDLLPGVYALYLKREDGATSKAFNFMLQPQRPVASALAPDMVSTCAAGREREVLLSGAQFQPGARVVFDGAAIATRYLSPTALSFQAPSVPGGLHQVQVKNPSEAVSGTLGLMIESKPEIVSVAVGRDFVSYYEVVITGRNFQQASVLVADGNRVTTGIPPAGDRDALSYFGCAQLVYQRHPYDPTPKEIKLQVVNPNGEESNVFSISAP